MTELPDGPWLHVKADFFGPLPSGDYILEVVDVYSRWVEVEIVRSTSAEATIPKLDKIFSAYGIPKKLTTDNGPPFTSNEFKKFAKYLGVEHKRTTPLWPQANSSAENFNRMLRKTVQSAKLENRNWIQEMYRYLRNYRSTPHDSTGKAPAEIMFSKGLYRTRLPQIVPKFDDPGVREHDSRSKARQKGYADNHRNVKELNFTVCDNVLVKQKKINKLTPPFNPNPYIIVKINGSMITAQSSTAGTLITRNSSFFKKIPRRLEEEPTDDEYEVVDNAADNANDPIVSINNDNENEVFVHRRNPPRERRRPAYLRDDIRNLLNTGN